MVIKTERLYIDSARRSSGSNSNSFSIIWGEDVVYDTLTVLSATMPVTAYNITSITNTLSVTEGVNTVTITVTPGLYNINALITTLATAMTANVTLLGTYTAAINAVTQRVEFTSTANFTINTNLTVVNSLASMLGYTTTQAQALTVAATELYDISPIKEVYISCDLPIKTYFNSEIRSILCKVPLVSGSFGDIIVQRYESSESTIQFDSTQHMNSMTLTLIDSYGRPVDLNGVDYTLEIAFSRNIPDDLPSYLQ